MLHRFTYVLIEWFDEHNLMAIESWACIKIQTYDGGTPTTVPEIPDFVNWIPGLRILWFPEPVAMAIQDVTPCRYGIAHFYDLVPVKVRKIWWTDYRIPWSIGNLIDDNRRISTDAIYFNRYIQIYYSYRYS
jgi:hypothetical protein